MRGAVWGATLVLFYDGHAPRLNSCTLGIKREDDQRKSCSVNWRSSSHHPARDFPAVRRANFHRSFTPQGFLSFTLSRAMAASLASFHGAASAAARLRGNANNTPTNSSRVHAAAPTRPNPRCRATPTIESEASTSSTSTSSETAVFGLGACACARGNPLPARPST